MKARIVALAGLLAATVGSPTRADGPGWEHRRNLLQEPLPENLDTAQVQQGKHFKVSYVASTADGKPEFNRMHDWNLVVEAKQPLDKPVKLAFSGEMPQHLHGLPTNVQITRTAPGRFVIEGLKFHMVGWWRFKVKVTGDGKSEDFVFNVLF